jgi:hypothetical protein
MPIFSKISIWAAAAALCTMPLHRPSKPPAAPSILGRWEVLRYSEQGVAVDKRKPGLPQAMVVYEHIRTVRNRTWYGYYDPQQAGRRERRFFEEWESRDSIQEVKRVADAIEMPYFAVFFADSTLSLYNKDASNRIFFPESRRYVYRPATQSLGVMPGPNYWGRWDIQVLELTDSSLLLFLPDEAEVVELARRSFILP